MTRSDLIPPSPSESEHREAFRGEDQDLFSLSDPIELFGRWFALASEHMPRDVNAMTVATVDADGRPDARTVLLKDFDGRGFTFYTNTLSAKGAQLDAVGQAALVFYWPAVVRQVRVRGAVSRVADEEADAYFATRARDSRIGAWASPQSQALADRAALHDAVAAQERAFAGKDPHRPDFWSGYRVAPEVVEFWHERPFRLHDRRRFSADGDGWRTERLAP